MAVQKHGARGGGEDKKQKNNKKNGKGKGGASQLAQLSQKSSMNSEYSVVRAEVQVDVVLTMRVESARVSTG